jgi:hypothetical protein
LGGNWLGLLTAGCCLILGAYAADRKPPQITGWRLASRGSLEVTAKAANRKAPLVELGAGAIVPAFEAKPAGGRQWVRVQAVDPAKPAPQMGWIDSTRVDALPLDEIPRDETILKLLGGTWLDDTTARNTAVARYRLRQGEKEPALVCYLGGDMIGQTRLQILTRSQGQWVAGPYLEFPFADVPSAVTRIEIRDLLGDGNECIITREPFAVGPQNAGVHTLIRRLEKRELKILWKAPLEARNLASYPATHRVLQPPEANIGMPGTVTKGELEFRTRGRLTDMVWKGKVEFYALGREEPAESVAIEKTCAWDGTKFAPLQ